MPVCIGKQLLGSGIAHCGGGLVEVSRRGKGSSPFLHQMML